MMALLRKVADPGDGEGRLGPDACACCQEQHHDRARLVVEAQRGMVVLLIPARRGEKSRRGLSRRSREIGKRSTLDIDVLLEGV